MRTFGLTAEQTTAAAHVIGLVGAALIIVVTILTGAIAVIANWLRTSATDPAIEGWTPPSIVCGLCIALIVGASFNDWLNTPKPAMLGTTSTVSSVETHSVAQTGTPAPRSTL